MLSISQPSVPDRAGDILHWRKLHGSAASLAVAELAAKSGPIVYVCSEAQHMPMVARELAFFAGPEMPVYTFPDWECLPYDRVSPHPDIVSQRLLALHQFPSREHGVLVVPITALMQRLAPRSYIDRHSFHLSIGDDFDTESFRSRLTNAGYYSV